MQSSKAVNKHMGSKELSGLTSANSSTSFTAMSVDGSQNPLAGTVPKPDGDAMPPAWINDIPFSDWEIDADDVAICLRPDGRKWELGAGAFSKVGLKPCNAIDDHGIVTANHGTFGRHECVVMACVVSLLHSAHKHSCLPTSCHCGHTCYAWKSSGSQAMVCQPKVLTEPRMPHVSHCKGFRPQSHKQFPDNILGWMWLACRQHADAMLALYGVRQS